MGNNKHISITLDVPLGLALLVYALIKHDWIAMVIGIFFMQNAVGYKESFKVTKPSEATQERKDISDGNV